MITSQSSHNRSPSAGAWHHASVVFIKCDKIYVYLDGALLGSQTYSAGNTASVDNANSFTLGSYGSSWYFNGKIDDVRVYNRALTASEITALYSAGTPPPPPAGGLVAHWKLDETSGTTASDGHNSTLVNGPVWTAGKINNALSFDGVNDTVAASITIPTNMTVSAWVKFNAVSAIKGIVTHIQFMRRINA